MDSATIILGYILEIHSLTISLTPSTKAMGPFSSFHRLVNGSAFGLSVAVLRWVLKSLTTIFTKLQRVLLGLPLLLCAKQVPGPEAGPGGHAGGLALGPHSFNPSGAQLIMWPRALEMTPA